MDGFAGGLAVADAAAALLPFLSGQLSSGLSQQLGSGLLNLTEATNLPALMLNVNNSYSVNIPAMVSTAPALAQAQDKSTHSRLAVKKRRAINGNSLISLCNVLQSCSVLLPVDTALWGVQHINMHMATHGHTDSKPN